MGRYSLQERLGVVATPNLQMNGWTISWCGYDDLSYQGRLFKKFGKRNACGYTLCTLSPFEIKAVRRWFKNKKASGRWVYISNADMFNDIDDKRISSFLNGSYCMWFEDETLLEEFVLFLEALPRRANEIILSLDEFKHPDVQRQIKKLRGNTLIACGHQNVGVSSAQDLTQIERQRQLACDLVVLDDTSGNL
jgi:hypothetical protein